MENMKIEIVSRAFKAMKGTSKQGAPYDLAMQDAYLFKGAVYPEKFEVPLTRALENGQPTGAWVPYEPGFYTATAESYQVRDGRLAINAFELKLERLPPAVEAAAASKRSQ